MLDDEDKPKKPALLEKPVLDPWSVSDLRIYIGALREEIARAEAAIGKKRGAWGEAEQFFKKK